MSGVKQKSDSSNTNDDESNNTKPPEGVVRPSLSLRLIRHAESQNNQVYRDARFLFRGGTPDFDEDGWNAYVDKHRKADPSLSEIGQQQAQHLADFLVPHLVNQASHPVRVVTSPMRRTLETIKPTLERLQHASSSTKHVCQVICNAFYHESEGCHVREKAGTLLREVTVNVIVVVTCVYLFIFFTACFDRGRNESSRDCGIAQGFHHQ